MAAYPIKSVVLDPRVPRKTDRYAPHHHRYVGLYHWCTYWGHWDKIMDVEKNGWWTVRAVDNDGNPLPGEDGRIRRHCTMLEATMFADRPFPVKSIYEK